MKDGMIKRAAEWAKGAKGRRIIVALGLAGIVLIAFSTFWPDSKNQSEDTVRLTAGQYAQATEKRLAELIENIDGAGKCQVMVTLENGVEYIYATQQKVNSDRREGNDQISQKDDSEQNIIIVDTENGRQGLLVTEVEPTVKGVVVVCSGGDDPTVCENVKNAITTALNISSRRVCVTK